MTKLATMGTYSCAAIAIGGFKFQVGDFNQVEWNEEYRKNKKGVDPVGGNDVEYFYQNILNPTSQPLGETGHYPFDQLMDLIDEHIYLNRKFTIATLNEHQRFNNDEYWHKRLVDRGFKQISSTQNNMTDTRCHMYVRDKAEEEMPQ